MKELRLVVAFFLVGLIGSGVGWGLHSVLGLSATITRLSPDETLRASLVERRLIDRNFEVRIEDLVKGETTVIFRSPDEGGPHGTERLIWSNDGTKLLLVGRHFFVKDDLFLDNGDQLYFLYDVPSGRLWHNADGLVSLAPLKAEMVEGVEFTEPVRMRK